jgi:hypothetical protein
MGYGTSHALTIDWITMDSFTIGSQAYGGGGGMMGTIETAAGSVAVNYDGVLLSSSVLNGYGYWGTGSDPAYMVDGTSYAPPTPYDSQMVMVNGGSSLFNVINFSTTVENPVMVGIPYPFGHPFHAHSATDSTLIRQPIPQAFGH